GSGISSCSEEGWMAEAAGRAARGRRWASHWTFAGGMLFGTLLAVGVPTVRWFIGPESPFVLPAGQPARGVEWAKLTLTRPIGPTWAEGRTRWEVVETPTGRGVRATADVLGSGVEATLLFAP